MSGEHKWMRRMLPLETGGQDMTQALLAERDRLLAENERLRDLLTDVVAYIDYDCECEYGHECAKCTARENATSFLARKRFLERVHKEKEGEARG